MAPLAPLQMFAMLPPSRENPKSMVTFAANLIRWSATYPPHISMVLIPADTYACLFDDHILPQIVRWKICTVTFLIFGENVVLEQMGPLQPGILFLFVFCSLASKSSLLQEMATYGVAARI